MKNSSMNSAHAADEEQIRKHLSQLVARFTAHGEQFSTAVPRLSLFRREQVTEPMGLMYEPSVCLTTQGAKRVVVGSDTYTYDRQHYLITSVHLPTVVQVIEASRARPYLGLRLTFDLREISQLIVESNLPPPRAMQTGRGIDTGETSAPLLDAFRRLVSLLDEPEDIPVLAPLIQREIVYRLLTGEQGARLRQIAATGTQSNQVAQAIAWLKDNFMQPFRIEELANRVKMSTSTFHHHFRAITAMSPLQYQKWLRLNEARRLMLTEQFDVSTAAFKVGYESPSQFSREYARQFGASPLRDITVLRELLES